MRIQKKYANVLLRSGSLGSKFLLILVLAKYLSAEEMGHYGLLTATITFALYLVGLDFYTFSTRQIIEKKHCFRFVLKNHLTIVLLLYLFAIPLLTLIFTSGMLPLKSILWFFALLLAEHLAQEGYRFLLAREQPVWANVAFFFRAGFWGYAAIGLFVYFPEFRTLETVWCLWLAGSIVGASISYIVLMRLKEQTPTASLNWKWISDGIKIAAPFLVSTLALRAIFTLDRYFIMIFSSDADVGVYSFFFGIGGALSSILEAGVMAEKFPALMRATQSGDYIEVIRLKREMTISVIIMTVLFVIMSGLFFYFFLPTLQNGCVYQTKLAVFMLLIFMNAIMSLGIINHYQLYALHKDRLIILLTFGAFLVALLSLSILVPSFGSIGAAISVTGSMLFLFVAKYWYTNKTISLL